MTSKAMQDVAAERQRQREIEGYSEQHDDSYLAGILSLAGAAYAVAGSAMNGVGTYSLRAKNLWPWHDKSSFKPSHSNHALDRRRDLVKAAALLIAEIERIDRTTGATHD
ncbi:hypothetical protein AC790_13310 [Pantoea sp. RIT-PI-b]|uniref:hypothetical protein n=1 Tax=Pantoea sp. RIT-PI-b TaxID=1681195 RepID=UPI0006765E0C|nr:hypothetical protein [Pantoea sp. RIT-PI-b]KNC11543.1 hypothetical protein AC790_13310 [Pantoea sp. RIT-PI-b]